MSKIEIDDTTGKSVLKEKLDTDGMAKNDDEAKTVVEKIEICYFCLQKFDINRDDLSHYKYDKYPMCAYCAEFYGFYSDDISLK